MTGCARNYDAHPPQKPAVAHATEQATQPDAIEHGGSPTPVSEGAAGYPITLDSPNVETFTINATPKRLAEDLFRSFAELGWGRARYSSWHPHDRQPDQPVVWGEAIIAHGETVHILAWAQDDSVDRLDVALRIGPLGTPHEQQRLRETLRKFLAGPPMRQYQGNWELPSYPGTDRWKKEQSK